MPTKQANTWPPLISANSQDGLGQQQLYGAGVLASHLVIAENNDEFFYPVDWALSGYSCRGILHQNGAEVPGAPKASWYTESAGPFRGASPEFPSKALILVTDAGISILDMQGAAYSLWMMMIRGDNYANTLNYTGGIQGFVPAEVSYQNGRVLVALRPDEGDALQVPAFLVFDFVADQVYLEGPVYPPPVVPPQP